MVYVFARAKSQEGRVEELRSILLRLVKDSRTEAGVLRYDLFETNDFGEFVFQEEYASQEAFQAHKTSLHVRRAVRQAYPLMDGGLTLWEVRPLS